MFALVATHQGFGEGPAPEADLLLRKDAGSGASQGWEQGQAWRVTMFEASKPNSLKAFIIKEMRAKGAERTHRQYAYSYQLVTAILSVFFGKNVCGLHRPIKDSERP